LIMYQGDHRGQLPDWLSNLFPDYVPLERKNILVCPSDTSRGTDGSKPSAKRTDKHPVSVDQFEETNDIEGNTYPTPTPRITAIERCSYMYEFCGAECHPSKPMADRWWYDFLYKSDKTQWATAADIGTNSLGKVSWQKVKFHQLRYGDALTGGEPNDTTLFPMVRCFHHYDEASYFIPPEHRMEPGDDKYGMAITVAYGGNVYRGPLQWEYTPFAVPD